MEQNKSTPSFPFSLDTYHTFLGHVVVEVRQVRLVQGPLFSEPRVAIFGGPALPQTPGPHTGENLLHHLAEVRCAQCLDVVEVAVMPGGERSGLWCGMRWGSWGLGV